jgi:hypothetical protein
MTLESLTCLLERADKAAVVQDEAHSADTITDVALLHPMDLMAQMLEYSAVTRNARA